MIGKRTELLYRVCHKFEEIENYKEAVEDPVNLWVLHHRDEIRELPSGMVALRSREYLLETDKYYDCPPNELIWMTRTEHMYLHNKFRSQETHEKLSNINKGRHLSEERKYKLSLRNRDKQWFTDGIHNVLTYKCPDGFRPGMTKRNMKHGNGNP